MRGGTGLKSVNPSPPRDAGLKSRPIPVPPPLQGGENPHGAKRGGAGQAGRDKIAIPMHKGYYRPLYYNKYSMLDQIIAKRSTMMMMMLCWLFD